MTGKQLKNSILQWAIQGKLVPQDPNDEPASVLLEKIRAEKARLVKEGKIKKDKNESIIYRGEDNSHYEKFADGKVVCIDEKIPFEIPGTWAWCKINNIAFVTKLAGFEYTEYIAGNLQTSGVPLFKGKNVQNSKIIYDFESYIPESLSDELERSQITKKCLLTPYVGTIGNIGIHNREGKFHLGSNVGKIEILNPINKILLKEEYLHYYLLSSYGYDELIKHKKATAQESISIDAIRDVYVAVPPIEEQNRICLKIDQVLSVVEQYDAIKSKYDKLNSIIFEVLKKSILQDAIQGKLVPQYQQEEPASILLQRIKDEKLRLVKEGKLKKKDVIDSTIFRGDDNKYYEQIDKNLIDITNDIPFDIPSNWVWTRIGYLFAHNNGKQLNKGNSAGTLMEYITTSNLYWDGFRLDNLKMMPFEESEIERCQAIKGDLLVCEGGDVGRSCIWTFDYPIMLQNHIHKLRAFLHLCTKYFFYVFYLYNLIGFIGGKGIGIQGFSAKALHNTIIPLPPLKEQERIVKKIEIVFGRIKGI